MTPDLLDLYQSLSDESQGTLGREITLDELRAATASMRTQASPGTFGIDVGTTCRLLDHPTLGPLICDYINDWVQYGDSAPPELFTALLTAIPKADRPTSDPANLRPISVTSLWYRIVAKVFCMRISPSLPSLYDSSQHGFCPGRNV